MRKICAKMVQRLLNEVQKERRKNISGVAKYLSSFLKFEVKNKHKSAEEAKA